jgi:transcriptional regulator with XRE-family HTH domain
MAGKSNVRLAKRLKELREQYGFTQHEVAERSGIDYKYYQTIEGKHPPNITLNSIGRLAKAFDLSPADLLRF